MTLTDGAFFNEFTQGFTPGGTLSFTVDLTTNVDLGGVPDEFSLAILDSTSTPIPTLGLAGAILLADIDSSTPSLFGYASDTSRNTAASCSPISLSAPTITPVPEPSLWWLSAAGLALMLGAARLKSRRSGI